jgi:hypothetical protein
MVAIVALMSELKPFLRLVPNPWYQHAIFRIVMPIAIDFKGLFGCGLSLTTPKLRCRRKNKAAAWFLMHARRATTFLKDGSSFV